jgi:hypothetical protein
MSNQKPVLDCRGIDINEGDIVVVANGDRRLREETVKRIEYRPSPSWWVDIRFEGGGYTTPDRVAVIWKAL